MMLHSLLPNSLSLSSETTAGSCSSDGFDDSIADASLTDDDERRTSHALRPIPLSHNF
jgi:hypothetical protein